VFSPGPATLAIAMLSAKSGRRSGLEFALGVSAGSLCWGCLSVLGLSSLLTVYGEAVSVLRVACGSYLLWLAFKSFRAALYDSHPEQARNGDFRLYPNTFVSGFVLHLLNPKAIFVWLAVVSLGLSSAPSPSLFTIQVMTAVCWVFGVAIYLGYALLFSSELITAWYKKFARYVDGTCGALFAAAGLKLLSGR